MSIRLAGAATLVLIGVAMSGMAILQWFHGSTDAVGSVLAQGQDPASPSIADIEQAPARPRCEECGVIDSTQRIAATGVSPAFYETTLRMSDGSMRVLADERPASLHRGEHIILIGGLEPPGR